MMNQARFNTFFSCYSTETNYSGPAFTRTMAHQSMNDIKASLQDMPMDELQEMSDDLTELISVLISRQVAIEAVISDRLEATFAK